MQTLLLPVYAVTNHLYHQASAKDAPEQLTQFLVHRQKTSYLAPTAASPVAQTGFVHMEVVSLHTNYSSDKHSVIANRTQTK